MRNWNLLGITLLALFPACSSASDKTPDGESAAIGQIVPPGKADNYFSTAGQEYTVTGKTFAVADSACIADATSSPDAVRRCSLESIGLKNLAIAWFLNQYIIDKHEDPNQNWGGFTAM